jgi:hypothetical protein
MTTVGACGRLNSWQRFGATSPKAAPGLPGIQN